MPYSNATVTMIDELPPMVQLPTRYSNDPPLAQGNQYTNTYYEEIVKDYPTVQSKIRPTEINPFAKYEETLQHQPQEFHPARSVSTKPAQPNYMVPNYPLNGQPPASLSKSYVSGDMKPQQQVQHLPITEKIPAHYSNPSVQQSQYPIVEHLGGDTYSPANCLSVLKHVKNCPLCRVLLSDNKLLNDNKLLSDSMIKNVLIFLSLIIILYCMYIMYIKVTSNQNK